MKVDSLSSGRYIAAAFIISCIPTFPTSGLLLGNLISMN